MRSAALALLLTVACAHDLPRAYREAAARAQRAAHAGRRRESAAAWDEAARAADRPRDRSDAAYRAADTLAREGALEESLARFDALSAGDPDDPTTHRARLEGALLRLSRDAPGDLTAATTALDALVDGAPNRGSGRRALDHRLRLFGDDDAAALAWLGARDEDLRLRGTDLETAVAHLRATRLVEVGRGREAVDVWRALFARRPFGRNPHWDDGHLSLARALRELGDARGAVDALDAMLARWEPASIAGSATAPRMPEAALLRARILRDDLRDRDGAAEAFRFVYERLRDSTLRDDAMWEEAEMREAAGDPGACALWVRLATELRCAPRGRRAAPHARRCGATTVTEPSGRCDGG